MEPIFLKVLRIYIILYRCFVFKNQNSAFMIFMNSKHRKLIIKYAITLWSMTLHKWALLPTEKST